MKQSFTGAVREVPAGDLFAGWTLAHSELPLGHRHKQLQERHGGTALPGYYLMKLRQQHRLARASTKWVGPSHNRNIAAARLS